MKTYISFILLSVIFIFSSCGSKKSISQRAAKNKDTTTPIIKKPSFAFDFKSSDLLSPILDMGASADRLVFLDLSASWCTPCKMMQRDVYTDVPTAKFFNDHFINYMVDVDVNEGPDIKMIYDVHVIPTLLFLDGRGRVVHKVEGALYHKDLIKNAEIAIAKKKDL